MGGCYYVYYILDWYWFLIFYWGIFYCYEGIDGYRFGLWVELRKGQQYFVVVIYGFVYVDDIIGVNGQFSFVDIIEGFQVVFVFLGGNYFFVVIF